VITYLYRCVDAIAILMSKQPTLPLPIDSYEAPPPYCIEIRREIEGGLRDRFELFRIARKAENGAEKTSHALMQDFKRL